MPNDNILLRVASFLIPIALIRVEGEHGAELEIRLENGIKVLNSANANYSFGSLHKVWSKALKTSELRNKPQVLVLGGGAGSIPRILRKRLNSSKLTLIEHDQKVIDLAREHFGLTDGPDLRIVHQDAFEFCRTCPEAFDLILIDLFNDLEIPPFAYSTDFWNDIDRMLTDPGTIMLNTIIHDTKSAERIDVLKKLLKERYAKVAVRQILDINHVITIGRHQSSS